MVLSKDLLQNPNVKGVRFMKNFGKSQACMLVLLKLKVMSLLLWMLICKIVLRKFWVYDMIVNGKYDLVSGWKETLRFCCYKNLPSKLFNLARKTSGVELNDFFTGLKAYKNIVVKNIEVSGEMHRYIPVLAKNALEKLGKVVQHQARKYGETKFEWNVLNGFLDLITIWFLSFWKDRCTFWCHGILDVHYRIYACWLYRYFKIHTIMICATVW
jgi:hypothetical protein